MPTSTLPSKPELSGLDALLGPIRPHLAAVDELLAEQLHDPGEGLLPDLLEHIRGGRGKYLRPALVFLAARAGQSRRMPSLVAFAAAVELIHQATLIHDDIIDDASTRRRRPSLPAEWGATISVLAGDHLYAKAFRLLASIRSTHVTEAMAVVTEQMTRGELQEIEHRHDLDLDEAAYFGIIEEKTAVLMSAACDLGAHLAGASRATVNALAHYGLDLGMAFQIADDCLDVVGDADVLGKDVGTDLLQGHLSLPLIYLLRTMDAQERATLIDPVCLPTADVEHALATIRRLTRERGAVDQAYHMAHVFAERAKQHVRPLGPPGLVEALTTLADFIVQRHA